jgi:hypothetical protein
MVGRGRLSPMFGSAHRAWKVESGALPFAVGVPHSTRFRVDVVGVKKGNPAGRSSPGRVAVPEERVRAGPDPTAA